MPISDALSPKTLQEAIQHYSDEQNCIDALAAMRWPDGRPICPACEHKDMWWLKVQKRWKCRECWKQFSVKINTVFEDSRLPLNKWMLAMWMIANCKNGVSSWEIHRAIGVTQKSAWFMLHRIRLAMQRGSCVKLGGEGIEVEVDETFIGGKARNMHLSEKKRRITSTGPKGKQPVWAALERGGEVVCEVVPTTRKKHIQPLVRKHVAQESALYSDALLSYRGMESEYAHGVIDHAVAYVNGRVHTNGLENFWSLLRRSIGGTYVNVEPFHLFRYLDEQSFRYNNRGNRKEPITDSDRFKMVLSRVAGKHITYSQLTGKEHLPLVAPEPF